jgi:hypothetical protein
VQKVCFQMHEREIVWVCKVDLRMHPRIRTDGNLVLETFGDSWREAIVGYEKREIRFSEGGGRTMRMRSRSLKRGSLRGAAPALGGTARILPEGRRNHLLKDSSSLEILHLEQRSPETVPQKAH